MVVTTPNYGFVTISGGDTNYEGEFDVLITAIDSTIATVSGSQKAIVAGSNVTVVSGTNQITISAAASAGGTPAIVGDPFISVNSGTNTIQLVADAIVGGTNVVVTSGTNQIVISAEEPPAIIGADGITVASGSNTTTLTGFRTEFVSASGSLQSQISSIVADEIEPAIVSNSSNLVVTSGSSTTTLAPSADPTYNSVIALTLSGTTITGTTLQLGETASAHTGNFSHSLTVSGLPVMVPKSFCHVTRSAANSTNLAVGDHIKWDSGIVVGNAISADLTTAYTTASGAASVGRFTLQPYRWYLLQASLQWAYSAAPSTSEYRWTSDTGVNLATLYGGSGSKAHVFPTTFGGAFNVSSQPVTTLLFRPTEVVLAEVRITVSTTISSYDADSYAIIQEL